MSEPMSLLEFLRELMTNVQARDWFAADPEAALEHYGLDDLTPADVHDALVLIEDNQTADFSRDYHTGANDIQYSLPSLAHYPSGDHSAGVQYLQEYVTHNYVTDNYIDDRDTIVDNSVNQQIDTDGGDFDQYVDIDEVTVSGDGAIGAGGDIEDSTLVTGDDNQVGDGNVAGDGNVVGSGNHAVTGHGNTTSFGDGDATSTNVDGDLTIGDGAAFATGGDAFVDNSDNSVDDSFNDESDNSVNDSGNDFSDNSVHDSGNTEVDESVHDSGNDNSDNSVDDSFDGNRDGSDDIDLSLHS